MQTPNVCFGPFTTFSENQHDQSNGYLFYFTHSYQSSVSGSTFTMLSFPQRLHLIGKFFISVSGSNHRTVCFPHMGQRYLLRGDSISFCFGSICNVFFNSLSYPFSRLHSRSKKKNCTIIAYSNFMAQALRLRLEGLFHLFMWVQNLFCWK